MISCRGCCEDGARRGGDGEAGLDHEWERMSYGWMDVCREIQCSLWMDEMAEDRMKNPHPSRRLCILHESPNIGLYWTNPQVKKRDPWPRT